LEWKGVGTVSPLGEDPFSKRGRQRIISRYSSRVFRLMVLAMRHGVLGYEAMGLNRTFHNPPFGVFSYEATRRGHPPKQPS
jgi:hypothetical protein